MKRNSKAVFGFKVISMSLMALLLVAACNIPSVLAANENAEQSVSKAQSIADVCDGAGRPDDVSKWVSQKGDLSDAQKKMSSRILHLTGGLDMPQGVTQDNMVEQMARQGQAKEIDAADGSGGRPEFSLYVYIKLKEGSSTELLDPYVSKIENQDMEIGLVAAWVDITSIKKLASLDAVLGIQEVSPPVVNSGSETSEGDAVHQADDVRSQLGIDGSGVKVGIISDGVDNWTTARNSGDLPADLHVLSNSVGGDEGTAMLEIVYDLAPGAQLYFHDCGSTILDFCDAVDDLVSAGCDIVCDDIGWIGEPFFEDGTIARHIQSVIDAHGIVYVSSAGNSAKEHHQGEFYEDSENPHWADLSHGSTDYPDLYAKLNSGSYIIAELQWDDAFGAAGNDYDFFLYNCNDGKLLDYSLRVQNGNDDPQEQLFYYNDTGSAIYVGITVYAEDASENEILEIYTYGADTMYTHNITEEDSIFGHPTAPDVISCGAIRYSSPTRIEYFSSRGPVTTLSGTRRKPDICGIDGVSVTGAGGFSSPFYGTSAASPHIAAIAALAEERYPDMTNDEIRQVILDNGVDLGSSGYDYIFGYGRSDALATVLAYFHVEYDSQGGSSVDSQLISNGGKAYAPRIPINEGYILDGWYKESACTNAWSFGAYTVTEDTTLYAKWETWVAQKDETVGGKLRRTYYLANGRPNKVVEYYGADDSSEIYKINYYTDGLRTSYRLFDESGRLKNLIQLYDNGNTEKVNYYNVSTGKRYAYKLYDIKGRMTHYTYTYSDGVKPKKTSYYNVSTGKRYAYKLYDTAGRTTHYIYTYADGVKPQKTNYYKASTGIRTQYKLYDTAGRTTHYAECYSDGIKAKKMNYYKASTGVRTGYKMYRTDGSCSCYVQCNSSGQPYKGTYYDEDGKVIKVVYY